MSTRHTDVDVSIVHDKNKFRFFFYQLEHTQIPNFYSLAEPTRSHKNKKKIRPYELVSKRSLEADTSVGDQITTALTPNISPAHLF